MKKYNCDMNWKLATLIATVAFFQACAPVYIPSARHTHQLDRKGELSASFQSGTNGADLQGAYAASDHIGIAAAASFGTNDDEGSNDYQKHTYGELALEYFKPFGIGRFELLGGGGFGSATAVYNYTFDGSDQQVEATGRYNKFFVQSNIGLETAPIEAGVALRLGQVTFTEFETNATRYSDSESGTFFEPALYARVGWKNVKLEGQYGISTSLQQELKAFDYLPYHLSLGINLNLTTLP